MAKQISYDAEGARQLLLPDVSFQLAHLGYFEWCLFEYERRATTPRRLPTRLRSYERYFKSRYAANDHGGLPPLVLFLFESERAEAGFLHVASFLPNVLLASTTTAVLEERGVLEQAWRLPPPHAPRPRRRASSPSWTIGEEWLKADSGYVGRRPWAMSGAVLKSSECTQKSSSGSTHDGCRSERLRSSRKPTRNTSGRRDVSRRLKMSCAVKSRENRK